MRRPGPVREIPPPLELECLKTLWVLGEASVAQVREAMLPRRSLAYTTVMTVLDRLARKGAAGRRKSGRAFLYAPVLSREALRRLAVDELVASLFGGSEEELLSYLQGRAPQTASVSADSALDTALL